MDSDIEEIIPPKKRLRTDKTREEAEEAGPSSQGLSFDAYGTGDQLNAPWGVVNKSAGGGDQFPGAMINGNLYFAFPEIHSRSQDIDTAARGTCKWLPQHQTFKNWASSNQGLLWIKGKPGSGKSTLLRYVLEHAAEICNIKEGALTLSFFFHGRGSELQKTPLGLFRSLLHQILYQVPDAAQDLVGTFEQRCKSIGKPGERWQWHSGELQHFLKLILPRVLDTCPVWLFIDALDECGRKDATQLVQNFKSLLQEPSSTSSKLHICFTCRHYPILTQVCPFEICLEYVNEWDISIYVRTQLSESPKLIASSIPDLIIERAEGVFMWARLVVDKAVYLDNEGEGLSRITKEIYDVPPDLDELYLGLIRSMDKKFTSLKLIQWICFAIRPLSLDELRWAMLIEADCPHRSLDECQIIGDYPSDHSVIKRRLQTLSCGLAEVTSDTKVVQFIHQSVKDFFTQKGILALDESTKGDIAGIIHQRLSRICLCYLAMDEIGLEKTDRHLYLKSYRKSKFPFLAYATTSWVEHAKKSDARSIPQEDLIEYFMGSSNTLIERWVYIYGALNSYSHFFAPEGTNLIHVVSGHGMEKALRAILQRAEEVGISINSKDSEGQTPLLLAAKEGHEAIVRLLLDHGAHIEAVDEEYRKPLSLAARNGQDPVVQLLLDHGADIEAVDWRGDTPLSRAAENGHDANVQLLLDGGADIEAVDGFGRTSLSLAAGNGNETIVRLLLDRGAHTKVVDSYGCTPLKRAIHGSYDAIVELLQAHVAQTSSSTLP
ncbi:ankyrin repeats (3 copies) domain-containing protein [Fusarium austroafricanum]|uniref:Ankyrin repeats (3 copies) domain-containing protein n=1 Tax=Fusarium austroafricanum TaxID=2364996 RepID=A0A8H4NLC8_9HYPO|nr:ankyrin repeats (3 copies) domain-containing protein [Fusarium austroafricanum]